MTDTQNPPEFQPERDNTTHTALLERYIERLGQIGDQVLNVADHCAKNYQKPFAENPYRLAQCLPLILQTERGIIHASETIERLKLAQLRYALHLDKKNAKSAKQTIQTPHKPVDLGRV